jgi:hypothetical protein
MSKYWKAVASGFVLVALTVPASARAEMRNPAPNSSPGMDGTTRQPRLGTGTDVMANPSKEKGVEGATEAREAEGKNTGLHGVGSGTDSGTAGGGTMNEPGAGAAAGSGTGAGATGGAH